MGNFVRRICSAVKRGAAYAVPVIGAASPVLAADSLDVSSITISTTPVYSAAIIVISALCGLWCIKRVISLFKG